MRKRRHSKITGKIALVTGGVGFIGSHLTEYLMKHYSLKAIRVFDNNEAGLFDATNKYKNKTNIRFMLGDIRDKERVNWALKDVDIAFHTAALKHVSLNEYNTFETVKNNIIGTQNLLEAALTNNIECLINVSSDKATNPVGVMGATKLLTERLTSSAKYYRGTTRTRFFSVRFGNVINSTGSVIPTFINQLKNSKKLTLTDKRMVRYFMSIDDAISLILKATTISRGGEVFILKMPALKITDLAEVLIKQFSKNNYKSLRNISIKEIGMKPGEKLYEKLVSSTEKERALELKDMYVIPLPPDNPYTNKKDNDSYTYYRKKLSAKPLSQAKLESPKLLSKKEITKLLQKSGAIDAL